MKLGRLWPRSLTGQLMLTVALALLLAQTISAILIYRAQTEMREAALIHTAAFRLLRGARIDLVKFPDVAAMRGLQRGSRIEQTAISPLQPGEKRDASAEAELKLILADQDVEAAEVMVIHRRAANDPISHRRLQERSAMRASRHGPPPDELLLAAFRMPGSDWYVARVFKPFGERILVASLAVQTLFIYAFLVGAIAFILRRITRPLKTLTGQIERFAETRDAGAQIAPEGPDDVRRLIVAHNAMEGRISALLDEKDVMLGAIGHDLKTPLAALRVRIESVENDSERLRMAATIEDIASSLDDILSLARAGRARDPAEMTELSALLASVVEEYEDMGEAVTLGEAQRMAMPLRATWLRRAIRNLIGNALRYGKAARVSLVRQGNDVLFCIDDDGPGIPEAEMARMLEPFTRGEASRNRETGGAGLGLALARAIAEQHGGALTLFNRLDDKGKVMGLSAVLRLPVSGEKA
jgi:signal transduction histidine kinase